jgi:hypothetical protein|tara:strand:- start:270 stop:614 length:345 start_codon:yes stop_codon:yes gene_type:complete
MKKLNNIDILCNHTENIKKDDDAYVLAYNGNYIGEVCSACFIINLGRLFLHLGTEEEYLMHKELFKLKDGYSEAVSILPKNKLIKYYNNIKRYENEHYFKERKKVAIANDVNYK